MVGIKEAVVLSELVANVLVGVKVLMVAETPLGSVRFHLKVTFVSVPV
jgi:hypothetical protein